MRLKVRQRTRGHNTPDYIDLNYKNKYDRGYALKERRIKLDYDQSKVEIYTSKLNQQTKFVDKYSPDIVSSYDDKLESLLLSKWMTYSSGFILPSSFISFCKALKDGVVLSKLLYNFFLLTEESKYDDYTSLIKQDLILNPLSEREEEFNFSLFIQGCQRIGIDSFNALKRAFLMNPEQHKDLILSKLFILEDFMFDCGRRENIREEKQDFINLREVNTIEDRQRKQQKKRLTSYYLLAIKHRKRLVTEKLNKLLEDEAFGLDNEEIYRRKEKTYLDISGKLKPSREFWDLKYDSEIEDGKEEDEDEDGNLLEDIERIMAEQEEVDLNESEEFAEPQVEEIPTTQSFYSENGAEINAEVEEEVTDEEDNKSEVFYVIDKADKEDEEMSLSSKLDLLLDSPSPGPGREINVQAISKVGDLDNKSIKSTKTVVYYVIDELNEVDKSLTELQNNIVSRFSSLKAKDRIVRALDIFGRDKNKEELDKISCLLDEQDKQPEETLILSEKEDEVEIESEVDEQEDEIEVDV